MLNDFVLRTIINLLEEIKILGKRISVSEKELIELRAQHKLLEAKNNELQKNYDDLLSLVLE